MEVLVAFGIIFVFLTASFGLIEQSRIVHRNSKNYYEICKTAESIIEALKSNMIISDTEEFQISDEILEMGLSFITNGYLAEIKSEKLIEKDNKYLVEVKIQQEESSADYGLYCLISNKEVDVNNKEVYEELKIEEWEILE